MKYVYKVIIVLYLIVGVVPIFDALDKVVTQWFYLNILNTIALIFLYLRSNSLNKYIFNKSSILFFTLVIWSAITIFFSINSVESIVVLSQFFAIAIGFFVVLVCISETDNGFKLISNTISLYLIVELISIYLPFSET